MTKKDFVGEWEIYWMETWDEDYFNCECQAYFKINKNLSGEFQFGLVRGQFFGEVEKHRDNDTFKFTFEGSNECDTISGSGRIKLRNKNEIEGIIRLHGGDSSKFLAKKR